jgi:dTDP-4-dehydrorhamnose 3,5-epimerase
MDLQALSISDVLLLHPQVFGDERGFFLEAWNRKRYTELGIPADFVQLNQSRSSHGILRGLHFQWTKPQGKLVRVLRGEVFDVAVDLRPQSPTFGKWCGATLTAAGHEQLWVPPGFAHGFCVLSEEADFEYLCSDYYDPKDEGSLKWNDEDIQVDWPIPNPILSGKDLEAPTFREIRKRLVEQSESGTRNQEALLG